MGFLTSGKNSCLTNLRLVCTLAVAPDRDQPRAHDVWHDGDAEGVRRCIINYDAWQGRECDDRACVYTQAQALKARSDLEHQSIKGLVGRAWQLWELCVSHLFRSSQYISSGIWTRPAISQPRSRLSEQLAHTEHLLPEFNTLVVIYRCK